MAPYRTLLSGERRTFETQHLMDLALAQLCALVLALAAMVLLGA
jgi:hypothetical protein